MDLPSVYLYTSAVANIDSIVHDHVCGVCLPVARAWDHLDRNVTDQITTKIYRVDNDNVIDATKKGNLARFINHCCEPNCYTRIIVAGGKQRIVLYSKKRIELGEEITYDYKFDYEEDRNRLSETSAELRANQQQNITDCMALFPKLNRGLDVNVRFDKVRRLFRRMSHHTTHADEGEARLQTYGPSHHAC